MTSPFNIFGLDFDLVFAVGDQDEAAVSDLSDQGRRRRQRWDVFAPKQDGGNSANARQHVKVQHSTLHALRGRHDHGIHRQAEKEKQGGGPDASRQRGHAARRHRRSTNQPVSSDDCFCDVEVGDADSQPGGRNAADRHGALHRLRQTPAVLSRRTAPGHPVLPDPDVQAGQIHDAAVLHRRDHGRSRRGPPLRVRAVLDVPVRASRPCRDRRPERHLVATSSGLLRQDNEHIQPNDV